MDISHTGFPLAATLSVVPVAPFLLRFTGFLEPGVTSIDDVGSTGTGKGAAIGVGIQMQFRAWHFVVGVDWENEWIADVATPTGQADRVERVPPRPLGHRLVACRDADPTATRHRRGDRQPHRFRVGTCELN